MKCPNCKYQLTENEVLLCTVGARHYCPRCWATISDDSAQDKAMPPPVTPAVKGPPENRGPGGKSI